MKEQLYWSPAACWYVDYDGTLFINNIKFDKKYFKLFPELYLCLLNGISEQDLIKKFSFFPAVQLIEFLKVLTNNNTVITGIQDVFDLFEGQSRLFNKSIFLNQSGYEKKQDFNNFIYDSLHRMDDDFDYKVSLANIPITDKALLGRCTTRKFNINKTVDWNKFSGIFSVLRGHEDKGKYSFYYSSGGGLYSIDFYAFIKSGRVENIEQGLYLYSPLKNELNFICGEIGSISELHYFTNIEIAEQSAFSIFFVYNAVSNMPKYGGLGYLLGILDAGIAIHALNVRSEEMGIGSCSIGEINTEKINNRLLLNNYQRVLHCMEFGNKL